MNQTYILTPTLLNLNSTDEGQVFKLTTRDNGATWYGTVTAEKTFVKELWVWGSNDPGQLGQNQPNPSGVSSPIQIPGTTWTGAKSIGYNAALLYKGV